MISLKQYMSTISLLGTYNPTKDTGKLDGRLPLIWLLLKSLKRIIINQKSTQYDQFAKQRYRKPYKAK